MVNPRKIYPIDPGLIPIYDRTEKATSGHALETCVMLELERRGANIAYIRTQSGYEVDFLALFPDGREELIQVCASLDDPVVRDREVRALLDAAGEHPQSSLNMVTLHSESASGLPERIALHSAARWLLS